MKTTLKKTIGMIDNLLNEVTEFVKLYGVIDTRNPYGNCDNIYAYEVDYDNDEILEKRVIALRVSKDNTLELLLGYKNVNYKQPIDCADFDDDDWYPMGTGGDCILTAQTILSIAECIDQYV